MKKLFTLFAMLTLLVSLNAQKINYQAVLRDTIDGKIELVRNQTGEVTFKTLVNVNDHIADVPSVVRDTQIVAVMAFETNADGMVDLPVDVEADGVVDWRDNMIIAEFTYGDNQKIVLVTPVTAVPYAIQAKDGNLTTGTITTYINNSGVADFNDIWKAFKDKEVLEKAVRDSIVEFLKLKENYEIAKKILYSYLNQVSGADVNEAYNTARNLDRETKDTIYSVIKDFLNNHHDLVIDVLEYYAQTATEEEMRAIYEDLKVSVGPAIKEYMNKYFDHYMETKGLVCQDKNLCDAIAAMNAGGSSNQGGNNQSTTDACEIFGDVVGCAGDNVYKFKVSFKCQDIASPSRSGSVAKYTISLSLASVVNDNFTATYVANSTNPTPLDVVVDGNTCYVEISNNNTYQSATVTVTFYYGADCSVSMTVVPSQELQPCGEQW